MQATHIRNELHHLDPQFVRKTMRWFTLLDRYFRYETIGLENIPKGLASLVIMNHGIIPYHGFLLAKHLVENRDIYPRGLGAGFLFSIPWIRQLFLKSGTVNANDRNAKNLLKEKNCVVLAPGGIYEGLVCYPGMKRIPWERRKGFIKLALETNTPIVPSYCDGINEVYYNLRFLLKWRIKMLESTRISLPLFFGIGLLPLPKKLMHYIGKPIKPVKKKGETNETAINRIHEEVMNVMKDMAI
ncbi:MAG: hypothetical protein A3G32_03050 [Deltaproteobacteria bacterium RIFCSPLOWO2_12_FULL_40_28]|nr:MAG: hypothetical protein A3C45_01735 [Deltaproteobacteria bacterium RIFCSPHIGHO2_02_FULL_40_28]OGQ19507.1 MAG: hypothetical protein A3E27_02125 [Deltaproteobacteria bacterium RIFCSPHIGHO2_12_FULL_40_32]OGQ39981.1 MAG: hypothetical protein A3I69_08090 [Deltaproteobacteria bacterium RIFCSPLOWO2_02_FULL_40_36]OGQ54346.1 MAG: hypothetical protein A3G32_03050 [Deltaproteobacteria bacterium RIFCSPLOWO2_12_FULL_40_28]